MANEVTNPQSAVPDYIRNYKKASIGNVDSSDRIVPRIKLIQAISPELQDYPDKAKAGHFWHTIAQESLGSTLKAVPIIVRKSYVLWAPRGDERGILARAMDGINWQPPDAEFTVKPKGSPNAISYKTKKTVAESGLDKFGTSIPGDPNSPPAASLTYNMMWYLIDFPEWSPSIIINTRSSVKPMQQLLSKIDAKPVPHYVQVYTIGAVQQRGAEGPYFNYTYVGAGFADQKNADLCAILYDKYGTVDWVASDEMEEDTGTKTDTSSAGHKGDSEIPF